MDISYLFRRQFILSNNPQFQFEGWRNLKLEGSFFLSAHPDLEISQSSYRSIQLTLLGYIVNPYEPLKSNQDILNDMVDGLCGFNDLIHRTDAYGGRWIIIYNDKNSFNLFHDPSGQRQVYYHQKNENLISGSDPAIINHFLPLEKDTSLELNEFVNSANFKHTENSWIGSGTIFKDVLHLMPNYYLSYHDLKSIRFWPVNPLGSLDLETAVDISAEILTGSLKAISNRHKLVMGVTGGWDSRVLLSASKEIHKDVIYFVSEPGNEKKIQPDVLIPSQLFKQLGIPFYVQKCDGELEPEFKEMLKNNILMARIDLYKAKYIYKYHLEFEGMQSVNGGSSEIARTCIRPILPMKVTGANLAKLYCINYTGVTYAVNHLDTWINESREICKENNLNIYDMLYWEQRMGNWGAQYPSEQDIAIEQFSPFNNRMLLTTLLSVDEKYRCYPNYILFYKIMEKLWPETLQQPFGMCGYKLHYKRKLKYFMRRMSGGC